MVPPWPSSSLMSNPRLRVRGLGVVCEREDHGRDIVKAVVLSSRVVPLIVQDYNTNLCRLVRFNVIQRRLESRALVVNSWFVLVITRFPAIQSVVSARGGHLISRSTYV